MLCLLSCGKLREIREENRRLNAEWAARGVPIYAVNPPGSILGPPTDVDKIRALNQWPVKCAACGHEYTPEEWYRLPPPPNGALSCDPYAAYLWRNCTNRVPNGNGSTRACGGTMQLVVQIIDPSQE
jgi:hypothetical protein